MSRPGKEWLESLNAITWQVASIGGFNGDGRDDILWRNDNGLIVNWLDEADGGFADNYANSVANIPITWHVQAPELL